MEHLTAEFGRIVNRPEGWYLEHFPEEWRKISQQVLRIADKELKSGGKRISDLSLVYPSGFQNLESDISRSLAALKVVLVQLSTKRQKPDVNKVIKYISENDNPKIQAGKTPQIEPYLIVTGTESAPTQVFLACEQLLLFEIKDFMTCPGCIIAMFYCLNTKYPNSCLNFYCFLEMVLLGKASVKVTPAVSTLLSSLV
jgi:hypothetical protein